MSYPHKKTTSINGKNIEIIIRSEADDSVFYEIFEKREYGYLEQSIKDAKSPIIDIGAHTGMFSIYASAINPKSAIFAYEPCPKNFEALKENFKINNISNVFPKNLAVSAETGQRVLFLNEDSHNHSLIPKNGEKEQKVFSTDIKSILSKIKLLENNEKIDLLKMDAEGIEFEIFENISPNTLNVFKKIYLEFHESESKNGEIIRKIFEKQNFKTKLIPSKYDSRFGFILAENKSF
jgi:FkbM family methyltransferase